MTYPTIEEVKNASHEQICRWHRFLPSPGSCAIKKDRYTFHKVLNREAIIMDKICERLKEFGGFTPEISKEIGW